MDKNRAVYNKQNTLNSKQTIQLYWVHRWTGENWGLSGGGGEGNFAQWKHWVLVNGEDCCDGDWKTLNFE